MNKFLDYFDYQPSQKSKEIDQQDDEFFEDCIIDDACLREVMEIDSTAKAKNAPEPIQKNSN